MNTWIVVVSLLIIAGCKSKLSEQTRAPADSTANPLVNTVQQGINTMDRAQDVTARLNAQTAQQQRAADVENP